MQSEHYEFFIKLVYKPLILLIESEKLKLQKNILSLQFQEREKLLQDLAKMSLKVMRVCITLLLGLLVPFSQATTTDNPALDGLSQATILLSREASQAADVMTQFLVSCVCQRRSHSEIAT